MLNSVHIPVVCVRNNCVTRMCSVMHVSGDGTASRIFDGCDLKDGSSACIDCHNAMQNLLSRNPDLPDAELAAAYNARRSR